MKWKKKWNRKKHRTNILILLTVRCLSDLCSCGIAVDHPEAAVDPLDLQCSSSVSTHTWHLQDNKPANQRNFKGLKKKYHGAVLRYFHPKQFFTIPVHFRAISIPCDVGLVRQDNSYFVQLVHLVDKLETLCNLVIFAWIFFLKDLKYKL